MPSPRNFEFSRQNVGQAISADKSSFKILNWAHSQNKKEAADHKSSSGSASTQSGCHCEKRKQRSNLDRKVCFASLAMARSHLCGAATILANSFFRKYTLLNFVDFVDFVDFGTRRFPGILLFSLILIFMPGNGSAEPSPVSGSESTLITTGQMTPLEKAGMQGREGLASVAPDMSFLQPGLMAPHAVLKDLNDLDVAFPIQGRWNLVVFWSLFCHICLEEVPQLVDELNRLPGNPCESYFIALDTARMKRGLYNFVKKRNLGCRVLLEEIASESYRTADLWGVKTTPSVFLIDPSGQIVLAKEGPFPLEELYETIRAIPASGAFTPVRHEPGIPASDTPASTVPAPSSSTANTGIGKKQGKASASVPKPSAQSSPLLSSAPSSAASSSLSSAASSAPSAAGAGKDAP